MKPPLWRKQRNTRKPSKNGTFFVVSMLSILSWACGVAGMGPVVREEVLSELVGGCQAAIDVDWQAAEMLLAQAAGQQPSSPLLAPLRNRLENQKREQNIERYLAAAVRAQSSGDLEGAVRELDRGLSQYPDETRLVQV